MLGQSIPQTDGVGKERAFQRVGAGEGDSEFHAVASCIHVAGGQLFIRNVYELVSDTVHHGGFGVISALLEGVPTEFFEHGGDTASPRVVVCGIPCCPSLDGFNLVNVFLARWGPYTTTILCNWSYEGVVTSGFDFTWAGTKVATKEAKGSHAFLGGVVDVSAPR